MRGVLLPILGIYPFSCSLSILFASAENFVQTGTHDAGNPRKCLPFLPNQVIMRVQGRLQRTKRQLRMMRFVGGNYTGKRKHQSQTLFGQKSCVIRQIVSRTDGEIAGITAQPMIEHMILQQLTRENQRLFIKVRWGNGLFLCQWVIPAQINSPLVIKGNLTNTKSIDDYIKICYNYL